ncbi:FG-GAP-like repeat-containing protein [Cellulomonas sp. S1-8]|uniref:FG-GAP-like repeat-containing protein n=1 Tax=Cellulomonas sp. S1-8 TaxID=2904790 RepID=UPI002244F42A|nr:FG-GAP-like repeat-containing protein [Cellulomonas sp. S1-8]UZN03685.1 FG-GAP-like repeat-containing protein [Cellulomonas sp. S1-8]
MHRSLVSCLAAAALAAGFLTALPTAASAAPGPGEPVLDIAHSLPTGGMNLWRLPIAAENPTLGQPMLQATLEAGGFRYDRSRTATGDFGNVTGVDDGSPDQLISHGQPNGGVLLWVVGGGPDATPRLWADLRGGGWSWESSRQLVGDADGDGYDDVISVHRTDAPTGPAANVWVHRGTGAGFQDPALWAVVPRTVGPSMPSDFLPGEPFVDVRYTVADLNGDGFDDLVATHRGSRRPLAGIAMYYAPWINTGAGFVARAGAGPAPASQGWSYDASRDVAADTNGDGTDELFTIHQQPGDGILVWERWGEALNVHDLRSDLRTGGWSYSGSRQVAADVSGDGIDELVSIHDQVGGGLLVWAHGFQRRGNLGALPSDLSVIADLRGGGWDFRASRESVGVANGTR